LSPGKWGTKLDPVGPRNVQPKSGSGSCEKDVRQVERAHRRIGGFIRKGVRLGSGRHALSSGGNSWGVTALWHKGIRKRGDCVRIGLGRVAMQPNGFAAKEGSRSKRKKRTKRKERQKSSQLGFGEEHGFWECFWILRAALARMGRLSERSDVRIGLGALFS